MAIQTIQTICSECDHAFEVGASPAMQRGESSDGHARCPDCDAFLHLQVLSAENATEPWQSHIDRQPTEVHRQHLRDIEAVDVFMRGPRRRRG